MSQVSWVRLAKMLLFGLVTACILVTEASEIVLRLQFAAYDDEQIVVPLFPGAARYYHDPTAVDAESQKIDPRDGFKPPVFWIGPEDDPRTYEN